MQETIKFKLAYIENNRQEIQDLELQQGATIEHAISAANITSNFVACGIWGEIKPIETKLQNGDRVELYNELLLDPKERRRYQLVS